jgi:hypothetical protein
MPNHNGVHRRDRRHHNHHNQSQQVSKKLPNSGDMIMSSLQSSSIATSNKLMNELISSGQSLVNHYAKCKPVRILIFTESFHPYTSGIARRFKEIITRLAKRGFRLHIVTGCKVISMIFSLYSNFFNIYFIYSTFITCLMKGCETWNTDEQLKDRVTFGMLTSIEFKDKIDCALPFILPQVFANFKKFIT